MPAIRVVQGCRYGNVSTNPAACQCKPNWGHNATGVDSLTSDAPATVLPTDAKARKAIPLCTGVLDYFPAALAEVSKVSLQGNIQHNGPDSPLFWARGKSNDQADTIIRHLAERGKIDTDGMRHSAKVAWRALALLQLELEAEGAPVARGAKLPEESQ